MKLCVILNPNAGSVKNLAALMRQIRSLKPALINLTKKAGDAKNQAREALRQKCDYIIAAGGDGTLNEVVNGMALRTGRARLGLLPLGTGNDFARCLKLPTTVDENIDVLRSGRTTLIDLVRIQSDRIRYFVNVSAAGFSGMVDEKLTPEIKRTWGPLAYIRTAAAAFPQLRGYRTAVRVGSREIFLGDLFNVVVANGRFVAGGLPIAPKADTADGLLDVILIPERSKTEIVLLAAQILLGRHLRSKAIVFRRTRKVSIRSRPGMSFNVDGELVGKGSATFEIIPRALQFVVGKR